MQHAHALELLSEMMHEGAHVLDVGSGSGYLTACMAMLVTVLFDCHLYFCIQSIPEKRTFSCDTKLKSWKHTQHTQPF